MHYVDVYVHGSDDTLWDIGKKIGLTEDAVSMFSHACDEVKLSLLVHEDGKAVIVAVDGHDLVGSVKRGDTCSCNFTIVSEPHDAAMVFGISSCPVHKILVGK